MTVPFDKNKVKTPCYVVDETALERNLSILRSVADRSGAKILLAQKAFSMFAVYPLISKYLSGTTASGLFEAKLGFEEMGGEVHIFSPAYKSEEFGEIAEICDHIIFNSFSQWEQFRGRTNGKSCGMRINPEHSTQSHGIYDPCSAGSRLGVTLSNFKDFDGLEGLHFHTLCEQNADALIETLDVVEEKFGHIIRECKWLNLGGGHHITRDDYDREALILRIKKLINDYGVTVYLEPGEAIALNAGYLISEVIDIVTNVAVNVVLDASAACHMPDVIEMPYRPPVLCSGEACEKKYTYRLTGPTCLAGDIIGDYSFDSPIAPGDRLVFGDMAIYTMVKNNTFNGMALPSIYLASNGETRLVKDFNYGDFKNRLS